MRYPDHRVGCGARRLAAVDLGELLIEAWRLVAPRRLVREFGET